jgi:FtsH-binding integral membrane protein
VTVTGGGSPTAAPYLSRAGQARFRRERRGAYSQAVFALLAITLLTAGIAVGVGMAFNLHGLAGQEPRAIPEARRAGWVIVVVCTFGLLFTILTAGLR